jgi:FkbM family methyltransferase
VKKTQKHDEDFVIPDGLSEKSSHFYKNRYPKWEQSSFWVYDLFSDKEKIFVDIGGWNGCTAIYAARKNQSVISFEPDPVSIKDFKLVLKANPDIRNITLIERPIYSEKRSVYFSPLNDKWNTSSSHIKEQKNGHGKIMKSATFSDINQLVKKETQRSISQDNLSLIKIDIESGEQYLLEDLLNLDLQIPLYISFHIEWWNSKNLKNINLWSHLTERYRHIYATTSYGHDDGDSAFKRIRNSKSISYIESNPFTSLVLTQQVMKGAPTISLSRRVRTFLQKRQ